MNEFNQSINQADCACSFLTVSLPVFNYFAAVRASCMSVSPSFPCGCVRQGKTRSFSSLPSFSILSFFLFLFFFSFFLSLWWQDIAIINRHKGMVADGASDQTDSHRSVWLSPVQSCVCDVKSQSKSDENKLQKKKGNKEEEKKQKGTEGDRDPEPVSVRCCDIHSHTDFPPVRKRCCIGRTPVPSTFKVFANMRCPSSSHPVSLSLSLGYKNKLSSRTVNNQTRCTDTKLHH